jgi:CBS domain-containing protein
VDEMTVASVMTRRVVTVVPEMPVGEVAAAMTETGLRDLPVVDGDGLPLGVVSEADLVLGPERWVRAQGRNAAEVMSTPVRAVHADEPVSFVAGVLARTGLRRLFVTDWDGRLVGVVSWRDLGLARRSAEVFGAVRLPGLPVRVR